MSGIASATVFSSVLPSSRSVGVDDSATFFATVVNGGSGAANGCFIAPETGVAANFSYQETDPVTNAPVGAPDTPVDISPGGFQTFLLSFSPDDVFSPVDVALIFDCANTEPAPTTTGLNTVLLSASDIPPPDIIALAATPSRDGIASLSPTGAFAVASANVGVSGEVIVTADTNGVSLPLGIALCETDPTTGACINPSAPTTAPVRTVIDGGETPTFGVFVEANGFVAFNPASNRIFVRFEDLSGITRGSTNVAVRSAGTDDEPPAPAPSDPGETDGGDLVTGPSGNVNSPAGGTLGSVTTPLSAQRFSNQFSAPPGRRSAPPDTIAYLRATTDSANLRLIQGNGSNDRNVVEIANGGMNAASFTGDLGWRPDGTEISFVGGFEVGAWATDLYAVTVDGSNLRRLTGVPRPIAYANFPQGKVQLRALRPDLVGGVTLAYIEGAQQAFGWLASATQVLPLEFTVADFGDDLFQESVVRANGLCYFDLAANVDVVAGTNTAVAQQLPPSSLVSDGQCPIHTSPQWLDNDELLYMKRRKLDITGSSLSFSLTRGPAEDLSPLTDGDEFARYTFDFELVEGNDQELLSVRLNPVRSTNEFLLLSQTGSIVESISPDKIYVGTLAAPSQSQVTRLSLCPELGICDLADAQFIPNQPRFVYSTLITEGSLTITRSQLRLYSNDDGTITDEVLVELANDNFGKIAVSPDGNRILVERVADELGARTQLWMYERDTREFTQFLADGSNPSWR